MISILKNLSNCIIATSSDSHKEGILCTEYLGMMKISNVNLGCDIGSFSYNISFDIYDIDDANKFINAVNLLSAVINADSTMQALGYNTMSGKVLSLSDGAVQSCTSNISLLSPIHALIASDKLAQRLVNYIGLHALTCFNFFKDKIGVFGLTNVAITQDTDNFFNSFGLRKQIMRINTSSSIHCKLSYAAAK